VDEVALAVAQAAASEAAQCLASLRGLVQAGAESLDRARQAAARSSTLDDKADCPVCGQALGPAFQQVRAHRVAELTETERRHQQLSVQMAEAGKQARDADARLAAAQTAADATRQARTEWEVCAGRHNQAASALRDAWEAVLAVAPARATDAGQPPSAELLSAQLVRLRQRIDQKRTASAEAERVRVRLERRATVESALRASREQAAHAEGRVQILREKLRDLAFDQGALQEAATAHEGAVAAAEIAQQRANQAAIAAASEHAKQEAAAQRLSDGEAQHARLAELESEARHLSRLADLLAEFRNTVVASGRICRASVSHTGG
jgi:hypothetical protein